MNPRLPDSKVHMLDHDVILSNYPKFAMARSKVEIMYVQHLAQSLGHATYSNVEAIIIHYLSY